MDDQHPVQCVLKSSLHMELWGFFTLVLFSISRHALIYDAVEI